MVFAIDPSKHWDHVSSLLGCVPSVLWSCAPDWSRALYLSPSTEKITGRKPEQLMRRPGLWFESIHPDDRDRVRNDLAALRERGETHTEYRFIRPDGKTRWFHDRMRLVTDAGGTPLRVDGMAMDFTAHMEQLGRLARDTAHDLANALCAVSGSAELLKSRLAAHGLDHAEVDAIRDAASHATGLTRQLLAWGRDRAQRPRPTDLGEAVRRVQGMLAGTLPERTELRVDVEPDLGRVHADPLAIEQICLNLALNARDAMPHGGAMTLSARRAGDDAVELALHDEGCGMDAATKARIFEPCFTTKPPGRGSGLGLSTVADLVHQAGGDIAVESSPGAGTTVTVRLPRRN